MTRRSWLVASALGVLLVAGCGGCIGAVFKPMSSARQPDTAIREEILAGTPLGSTEDEVDHYAKSRFQQDNYFHWHKREGEGRILVCLYGSYRDLPSLPF